MKRRPGVAKAIDEPVDPVAGLPAIGTHDAAALSLAIDEWAPADDVQAAILRRVRKTVDPESDPDPDPDLDLDLDPAAATPAPAP